MSSRFPVKGPAETIPVLFDFTSDLPSGVTLTGSPTLTVAVIEGSDASPAAILDGGAGFNSSTTGVIQAITSGVDGCDYLITCTTHTTQSNLVLTLVGILPVRSMLS